jgi:hypothetical protein
LHIDYETWDVLGVPETDDGFLKFKNQLACYAALPY